MSTNFRRDLSNGQKYEQWFTHEFLPNSEQHETNDDKLYDILHEGKKYEVKCDSNCFIFYRIGFEVYSWTGPSGIMSTEADYWINIIPFMNYIVLMPIPRMREFVQEYKYDATVRATGDEKASKMILWDYDFFMDKIDNIDGFKKIKYSIPNLYGNEAFYHLINKYIWYSNRQECKHRMMEKPVIDEYYNRVTRKIKEKYGWTTD